MEYNRQWTTMKDNYKDDSNEKSKRRIKWWGWLAIAVAVAGAAALVTLAIVKLNSGKAFPYEGDYPNAVTVELVDEEGIPYTVDAIEGQICVWFDGDVSYRKAKNAISKSGGKIVAQIPDIGYYLVEVTPYETRNFLSKIQETPGINWAFPNLVSYPSAANTFILDNYYQQSDATEDATSHGVMVQFALEQISTDSPTKAYNIGNKNGKSMCTNSAVFAINEIASSSIDGPIIINMSFGPYLRKRENDVRYYWKSATDDEKQDYQKRFLKSIQNIIRAVKPLSGKDFVITKSAGNNGVKVFDAAIITYLQDNLEPDEIEILDKHFLIVTAGEKEKKNKDYSNEMENGHYSPWVTKVDISDFKYNGKRKFGTSFAAPRAAGILSWAVNKYDLSATEVLKFARKATEESPDHTLTLELLEMAIENDNSASEVTIDGVLKMYLLNNMGDGSVTYYLDEDGNTEYVTVEDDYDSPYSRAISQYIETDGVNECVVIIVEVDNAIDIRPYLTEDDMEFCDEYFQSAFMVVPNFQYTEKDFAETYANKRVRAKGTLYVPLGGWRNATDVVMDLRTINLLK